MKLGFSVVMEELKKIYSASTKIEDKITTGYEYLKNLNFLKSV